MRKLSISFFSRLVIMFFIMSEKVGASVARNTHLNNKITSVFLCSCAGSKIFLIVCRVVMLFDNL